jgi:hypothetical protein
VELYGLDEYLPEGFNSEHVAPARKFRAAVARIARLLYSAVYVDDDIGEDLRFLRDEMAPRSFDGFAQLEKLEAARSAA